MANHMPALHGLRGIAALWVMMFHMAAFLPEVRIPFSWLPSPIGLVLEALIIGVGWCGVYLFFVLSGYLLGGQLWRHQVINLKSFYLRRVMRIYPAAWWQLLIAIPAWKGLSEVLNFPETFSWQWLFTQASLLLKFSPWPFAAINGVWWTLPVELSFYLILPLLVWLMRRMPGMAFLLLTVSITISWRWWFTAREPMDNYLPLLTIINALPGCLSVFCAGMLAARYKPYLDTASRWWLLVPIMGIAILFLDLFIWHLLEFWTNAIMQIYWVPVFGLCMALLVGLMAEYKGWLASQLAWYFGERSYSIYLWHLPIIVFTSLYLDMLMSWQRVLFCLLFIMLASEISYRLIEAPAMRLARAKRWLRQPERE